MTGTVDQSFEELRAQGPIPTADLHSQCRSGRDLDRAFKRSMAHQRCVFLGALTFRRGASRPPRLTVVVSLTGFVFALVWLLITLRGDSWMQRWNRELAALEDQAWVQTSLHSCECRWPVVTDQDRGVDNRGSSWPYGRVCFVLTVLAPQFADHWGDARFAMFLDLQRGGGRHIAPVPPEAIQLCRGVFKTHTHIVRWSSSDR